MELLIKYSDKQPCYCFATCVLCSFNQVPFEAVTRSYLTALTLCDAFGSDWKLGFVKRSQIGAARESLAGVTNNHSHKQQQQLWIIVSQRHRRSTPFSTAKHEHKTAEIHFKLILQSYFNWIYDGKYAIAIYLPWKPSAGDISLGSAVEATLANLCVDVPSERNKEILVRASRALWFFISGFMISPQRLHQPAAFNFDSTTVY